MIIIMRAGAPKAHAERIVQEIETFKLTPVPMFGVERTVIAVIGDERNLSINQLEAFPGVEKVMRVLKPYKLVSRETKKEKTVITVNGVKIGHEKVVAAMAGPCSVESEEQMEEVCSKLQKLGIKLLRGGAYKPRTGPYSFQGLGPEGLDIMRRAADRHGMAVITEVLDIRDIDEVAAKADILQIGTRNMQNYALLKEVGKIQKPIMLKRGMNSTIEEWLLAAEYILANGNPNVILCERGIRTFEDATRNTLAIDAVPLVKELSHLPVIIDPTHGTGKKSLIEPMTKAGIAAGADGFIIEVHPNPEAALSDAQQQITPKEFATLLKNCKVIAQAVNKEIK